MGYSAIDLKTLGMIGSCSNFQHAIERARRVADLRIPVMLKGETGTGKELFARALHYGSARAGGPLIPLNCGAIPDELFESELFGHERGAFTDARSAKSGLIELANNGTLFLDEVEALSSPAQAKLLRFLEDRKLRSLGSTLTREMDVRIVVATNEDLADRVARHTFREDLYYRLRVVAISIPPLRDRREDISALAEHFLRSASAEFNREVSEISPAGIQKLINFDWPGNVRELKNVIQAAVALSSSTCLNADDLEIGECACPAPPVESMRAAKARAVQAFEVEYLRKALAHSGGNISKAARTACKNRRAFFALLKKHRLAGSAVSPTTAG
jgi:transcriptional regulator with PAS, ATPase and Fis domain